LIRVAVVSPTLAVRAGLSVLLGVDDEIEVVWEYAAIPQAARREHRETEPDVIVLAVLPGSVSETGASQGGEPPDVLLASLGTVPVLYLFEDETAVEQLTLEKRSYAWGVLPINSSSEELCAAVHALSEGLWVGSPSVLEKVFKGHREEASRQAEPLVPLTEREDQVLQLLAQGLANKQIAVALGISEHTVKFHVSAIYTKLDTTNRTEAVRMGIQKGLVIL
jgi:DNA-binding NarL/FixJ family response regulator